MILNFFTKKKVKFLEFKIKMINIIRNLKKN